jgi:hypothetical protein
MTNFEHDLQRALRRREPPRDLTADVMARIEPRRRILGWRPALAAAAVVLLMLGGWDRYREYRQGVQAKEQLMLAVQITTVKLAVAQAKISELNRRRIGHDQ